MLIFLNFFKATRYFVIRKLDDILLQFNLYRFEFATCAAFYI